MTRARAGPQHPLVPTDHQRAGRIDLPTGTVTFLFTDIEGSTRLSRSLGDGFAAVIDRHHAIMRDAFAACGGVVVSTEGDAFFAVFIDPVQAVVGTINAQRALAAESWPEGVQLRVRMGLHTGAGRRGGDDYAGIDVNRAARVSNAGHGGQVLLSGVTATLVADRLPDGVHLRELGEVLLKDIDEPQAIVQLDIEGLPSQFPPLRAARPGWLPEPLTSFLGRGPEIDAVDGYLRDSRLVTLTGPGGTGKTRLSLEVARAAQPRFPGGAWFVPLEAIREPALVLPEMADRLGVQPGGQRAVREALADQIGSKKTLLVLDNLEQVVDVGTELSQLLGQATGLHILASSREALRLAAEQEYPVPVMDVELALLLFVERARKVKPGFVVDEESSTDIRAIVSRLDCLPLAIELAAARTRLFPPRKLRERLEARLEKLSSGNRDAPHRQRTLRGAVEWSYELLDDDERTTFARFSVFAGGAGFEAAEEVIDPGAELDTAVLDTLAALADKSLLRIEDGPDGEPRAKMLETIREFAAERLAESSDLADVQQRHAQVYVDLAERMEPELIGEHPSDAFTIMEAEHDNLRAALDRSLQRHQPALGLRIGGAIWRFWQQRAHLEEGRGRLERLLAEPTAADDRCAQAKGATGLGGLVYWQGDHQAAKAIYALALRSHRDCGSDRDVAMALYDLAFPTAYLGDAEASAKMYAEALGLFIAAGDENGVVLVREGAALAAFIAGDYPLAYSVEREVVALRRGQEGLFKRADSIGFLAIIEAVLGMAGSARAHVDESFQLRSDLNNQSAYPGALQTEGLVRLAEGHPEDAAYLAGTLQGMRDDGAKVLIPSDALRFTDPESTARELLGDAFLEHFEAGRKCSPQEALERIRAKRERRQASLT
ncbi:MAG: adenylate/guanylate cyclase domain-containing protein [Chloroflexota bacterium]